MYHCAVLHIVGNVVANKCKTHRGIFDVILPTKNFNLKPRRDGSDKGIVLCKSQLARKVVDASS
jgi:hypothetical protein